MCKVLIGFYSMYGHIFKMAEAAAEGAGEVAGCEVIVKRVPETLPGAVLRAIGAKEAQQRMAHIPIATVDDLVGADAIIFGTPTRFGNMCGQMSQYLDGTGQLWQKGSLVGKVGSIFTSSAARNGGQESTILSFYTTLLHQGMVVVGMPSAFAGQTGSIGITGCSPLGASSVNIGGGDRVPSENELAGARCQAAHVARIALKLRG
jgi:NAD(P)H dehydrogenase (quinone)